MKDKSDMIEMVLLLSPTLLSVLLPALMPDYPYNKAIVLIWWVVSVVFVFLIDYYYMVMATPYNYIRAVIRPTNKIMNLFIEKYHPVEPKNGISSMRLELKWPITHEYYGEDITEIIILYKGIWSKRMQFVKGRALRGDYVVDHGNTANVILYEPRAGGADMYRDTPKPVYILKEAPGDYYADVPLPIWSKALPKPTVEGEDPE